MTFALLVSFAFKVLYLLGVVASYVLTAVASHVFPLIKRLCRSILSAIGQALVDHFGPTIQMAQFAQASTIVPAVDGQLDVIDFMHAQAGPVPMPR